MVLGKNFIWLHFGKCGGTTTRSIFRQVNYLCEHVDLDHDPKKHQKLDQIKERFPLVDLTNKKIIIGFRKLIPWIYSHNNHQLSERKITFDDFSTNSRQGLIWHSGLNKWVDPDVALIRYLENKKFDHLIRTEYIEKDFVDVFSNFGLKDKDKEKILKHKQPLLNRRRYTKEKLSDEVKKEIYKQNPFWYSIQQEIYNE